MIGKFLTGLDMPSLFLGWAFFALVGVFLSILLQTTKRDIPAPHTPVQFSWSFLWSDNSRRVYTAITVIYIALLAMAKKTSLNNLFCSLYSLINHKQHSRQRIMHMK